MKHLNEMRIMELALHDNLELSSEERSHLDACGSCQTILEEERQLTANLVGLAPPAVPAQLLEGAVSQFHRAHRTFFQLPVLIGAILALLTGGVIVALIGFNYTAAITTTINGLGDLFTLGKVFLKLALSLPYAVQIVEFSLVASFVTGLASLVAGRQRAHSEISAPMKRTKG